MKHLSKILLLLHLCAIVTAFAQTRTEKDLLGEKQIPADAYYGVQTARAWRISRSAGLQPNFIPIM